MRKSCFPLNIFSFVGVPVIYLVKNDPDVQLFVVAGVGFIICVSLLLLLFVPKVLIMMERDVSPTKTSRIKFNNTSTAGNTSTHHNEYDQSNREHDNHEETREP